MHRLFHESMKVALEALVLAGKDGVKLNNGKGDTVLGFPILACFAADYPEECLITGCKYNACPKCYATKAELGYNIESALRTQRGTLKSLDAALGHQKRSFHRVCRDKEHGLSGYVPEPFWENLPYADIHLSITPDVLHQLYSGVFVHMLGWCQTIVGKAELDERVKRLPPSFGIRQFSKGFSVLSNISGGERKHMAKILLGVIIGAVPKDVIHICRALLDFIYIAQYPSHSNETMEYLNEALNEFHNHKEIIITLGIQKDFDFPKLHSMLHYNRSITLFGTTDNYNTEMFERLHAEYVKPAFNATNKRNERPQMLQWYTRHERVEGFQSFLEWKTGEKDNIEASLKTKDGRPFLLAKRLS